MATYRRTSPVEIRERLQRRSEQFESVRALREYQKYIEEQKAIEQMAVEQSPVRQDEEKPGVIKRALDTYGNLGLNVWTGLGKGLEGGVDFAIGLVGAVGGLFSSDFKEDVKEVVAHDFVGETLGANDALAEKHDSAWTKGTIVEDIAQGVGQMLPAVAVTIATSGAGAPALVSQIAGMAATGVSAAGSATEQAYNDGAGYYEGLGYGVARGATEAATEAIGGYTLGNATSLIGKKIAGTALGRATSKGVGKVAYNFLSEGAEEVLSDFIDPATKSIYKGKDAFKEYKDPEFYTKQMPRTFVSGGAVGSIMSGGQTFIQNSQNKSRGGKQATQADDMLSHISEVAKNYGESEAANARYDAEISASIKDVSDNLKKMTESQRGKYLESIQGTPYRLMFDDAGEVAMKQVSGYNADAMSVSLKQVSGNLKHAPTQGEISESAIKVKDALEDIIGDRAHVVISDSMKTSADGTEGTRAFLDPETGVFYVNNKFKFDEKFTELATVIHELYHSAEGTKQSAELHRALGEFVQAFPEVSDQLTGGVGETITNDLIEYKDKKYNAAQQSYVYATEIDADILGKLLGSEEYVAKLAVRNANLVKKVYTYLKAASKSTQSKQVRRALDKLTKKFGNALDHAKGGVLVSQIGDNEENMLDTVNERVENVRYSKSKSFSEQVDDVLNGADTSNSHLKVMETPELLQKAGLPNLPILMTAKHLKTITSDGGDSDANYHGLDVETVKKLPEYISSPVMIADSLTRDDSIVIITEALDSNNNPVIAAVMLNGTGRLDNKFIDANIMTSAYGKDNFQSFINRIADNNAVIYWNRKKSQSLSVNLGIQFPDVITNLDSDIIIRQTRANVNSNSTQNSEKDASNSKKSSSGINDRKSIAQNKQRQLEIIQETNPMWDDYHVGIRTAEDIRTWAEVLELNDESEGQFIWGDFSRADAEQALKDGTITVYSSYPIKNGVFVSTSYIQAQEYAGGRNGKVYSKTIPLTDVAWINGDEGQYASVEDINMRYSKTGSSRANNQDLLENRVSGDELLDAQDLIEVVKEKGGEVDENGYITLYHRTSAENAEKIRSTGYMKGKEDGLFFSTAREGYASGYGDTVVEFSIPAEKLVLDDIFDNEAHLKLPMKQAGMKNVRAYLVDESADSQRLTEDDLETYISAGTRANKSKLTALRGGKKIILTSKDEITSFIKGSIQGERGLTTVAYGKVSDRLARDVESYSKGKIKITGNFLELVPDEINHAYKNHLNAKQDGDIDLSMDDFESIPEYIDNYDDLVYAINFESGNTRICLSKKLKNGRVVLIETVSKSRGSVEFKNIIGVSDEKYITEYENKYKKRSSSNTGGSQSSNISPHDKSASNNSIPQKSDLSTEKSKINDRSSKTGKDTVEMSRGEIEKLRANYQSEKVFDKKGVSDALNGITMFKKLPSDVRSKLIESIWTGFNEHRAYDRYIEVMTERLYATIMQETDFELYELDVKESKDAEMQLKDEIKLALQRIVDGAKESTYAKMQKKAYAEVEDEIKALKAERDKLKKKNDENDAWAKSLTSLLRKIKTLEDKNSGKYVSASQYNLSTFKGAVKALSKVIWRGDINITSARKHIATLSEWYGEIDKDTHQPKNTMLTGIYNEDVAQSLKDIATEKGKLTVEELDKIRDIADHFIFVLENDKKVFLNGKYEDAPAKAKEFVKLIQSNAGKDIGALRMFWNTYLEYCGDPMMIFRRMDKYKRGFWTTMGEELRAAAAGAAIFEMETRAPIEQFLSKHKKFLNDLENKTVTYNGTEIPLGIGMNLYCTLKREQAQRGLMLDGVSFTVNDKEVNIKGLIAKEVENGDADQLKEILAKAALAQDELYKQFSAEQKEYIKLVEKALNEDCKNAKQETDKKRFGISNVIKGFYWPIKRANTAKTVDMFTEMDRVSTVGFNKDTVKGARGVLRIESIDSVVNRHIKAVSMYSNLATVIDSYNVLYNMDISGNPNDPVSVSTQSRRVGWKKGNEYVQKLLSDIQEVPSGSNGFFNRGLNKLRGTWAKFQLGLNPKVIVTQTSSFVAATNILDPDCVAKGMTVDAKDVYEYSKLAKHRGHENVAAQAQGLIEKTGKLSDAFMQPIGWMDSFVVKRLFGACQLQIQREQGLVLGSKENKIAAGKLLDTVIFETQQNAFASERSAAMRSGETVSMTLTMFTSDSMKLIGRVIDAVGEVGSIKAELNVAKDPAERATLERRMASAQKQAVRSVSVLVSQAVFMALVAQLFRTLYAKDDEDDNVPLNMTVDMVGNLIGGLPLVKDVYAYFAQGYELDIYAYSAFNGMLDSAKSIMSLAGDFASGDWDDQKMASAIKKLAFSAGEFTGLPTRNVYNFIYGITKRFSPSTAYQIDNWFYKQSYKADLADAIEKGDDKMISVVAELMINDAVSGMKSEGAAKVMVSLAKKGYDVVPRGIGDSVTINKVEYTLDAKQKKDIKDVYQKANDEVEELISSKAFNTVSAEIQAKAIKSVYDTYYQKGLSEALGVEVDNKMLLFSQAFEISELALIIARCRAIAGDVDADGKTISGSKKTKVAAYIESLRLTAAQKYMIMGYLGYKNKKGEAVVRKYIQSLRLTKEQKEKLFEESGY